MRPFLEKLPFTAESSLAILNRRLDDAIPFQWHHHPEFELTLTLNSVGQRFVGDHVGEYGDGDLVLVGPDLPHTWASRDKVAADAPHVALVMWFHPDWASLVVDGFAELGAVGALLKRARNGLGFSTSTAAAVRSRFEQLFVAPPAARLLGLLSVLDELARDTDAAVLSSHAVDGLKAGESRERIDRVLLHIHMHYARPLPLEELAEVGALSLSGLHRMFVKHTGVTVSDYLIRMRIGDACARLSGTDQPIGHVADAVGYASLANFNRQFRALKGMTPRDYRRRFRGG